MRAVALLFGAAAAQPAFHLPLSMKPEEFRASTGQKIETYEGNFTFVQVREERVTGEHLNTWYPDKAIYRTFFKSPPMDLKTGGHWFSLPSVSHLPMPAPKDAAGKALPFAALTAVYDMQDDTGRSVPVSEVYLHHWLMYDEWIGGSGDNLGCGGSDTWVSNIYGAGDEMRGIAYHYPQGYAQIAEVGRQHWSGNLHFIRTEDLIPNSLKLCAECSYQKGKAAGCVGGMESYDSFLCCMQGARCPVNNPKDKSTKRYYLTYVMTWADDISGIKGIHVKVIDAFNCAVTHSVGPNQKKVNKGTTCGPTLCESIVEREVDETGDILWAYTHIHIGAMNSSLHVNGKWVCDSIPKIGKSVDASGIPVPGDEKGFLIGFSMCLDAAGNRGKIHVNKGDKLKVIARISVDPKDDRSMPMIAGGEHRGQMALFYFYLAPDNYVPPTPSGPKTYVCNAGMCTSSSTGGGTLAQCQAMCGDQPQPPPAPAQKYACKASQCVAAATGVDLATCQLAC